MGASHEATFRQCPLLSLCGMGSTSSVVLVGHGMVGHRFVEALRARDADGAWRVTVLAEGTRRVVYLGGNPQGAYRTGTVRLEDTMAEGANRELSERLTAAAKTHFFFSPTLAPRPWSCRR